MTEILALLQSIAPLISKTTLRQMSQVIFGMLIMTGRITMLGISRWTEKGGSYRTIQRLYHTAIPWAKCSVDLFSETVLESNRTNTFWQAMKWSFGKAGKETYGLDRFFSSLQQRVIPGLSFFAFSLINVREEQSYPMQSRLKWCEATKRKRPAKPKKQARKNKEHWRKAQTRPSERQQEQKEQRSRC